MYVFTIQRAIHSIKGDYSKCIFQNYSPFSTKKKLGNFVISLLLLKIYTGTRSMCSLSKEQSILSRQGRQFKTYSFLRIVPLFRLIHFILFQAPHSQGLPAAFGALFFNLNVFNLTLCHRKRGFLAKFQYFIQFLSKFHETSWLYCLLRVFSCSLCF